jgi:predicted nucleotidyltransferase component of viral defense system
MADTVLRDFHLVGGTALALHYGHRLSEDLDLFSESDFDLIVLRKHLQDRYQANIYKETGIGYRCMIQQVKADFLNYPYRALEPPLETDGIRLLTPPDIAAMKISAISSRGAKRDFYDLYFLLQRYSFQQIFDFFSRRYKVQNLYSALRSLTYFDDAESDPDPVVLREKTLTWKKVKNSISAEVKKQLR